MLIIAINILGLFIIGLIVWWFWLAKAERVVATTNEVIPILVKDGVYQPQKIQTQLHQPITLRFTREDPSPCAETVVFNSLNISRELPLHQSIDIQLLIEKPGEYEFTCQMGMYRGKIIVTEKTN